MKRIPGILLALLCVLPALRAQQQPRSALVIGNGAYEYASLGQVPVNDAIAMRDALKAAGFTVDFYANCTADQMQKAISDFGKKVQQKRGVALFYYSGHGLQYNNRNYLVPIGAELSVEQDITGYCIPVERVVSYLTNTAINIVLLDACRAYKIPRMTKSLSQGLTKETFDLALPELIVGYATQPGGTASVLGDDNLSLYTSQLVKYMRSGCLKIEDVFKNTRREVLTKSNRAQWPEESGSLISDFYFNTPCPEDTPTPQQPITAPERNPLPQPGSTDSDLDGVPDASDPCPKEYGTANGCPDYDDDGVADGADLCPRVKGPRNWKGCPDSDGDGLHDGEDDCDYEKGTAEHKGCPPPDRDRDGVADASDACPDDYGLPALYGCPDSDGDGVADKVDVCPNEKGLKHLKGCPDSDGDGLADREDECPNLAGAARHNGCPPGMPEMVKVQGGTFTMGSSTTEKDRSDDETQHPVKVSDFYIAKYEVTQALWREIMGSDPRSFILKAAINAR